MANGERQFYFNPVMSGAIYEGRFYEKAAVQVVVCTGRAMRFSDDVDTEVLEVVTSNGYRKYKKLGFKGMWERRETTDMPKDMKTEALLCFDRIGKFLVHSTYAKQEDLDQFHVAHAAFCKRIRQPKPPPLERKVKAAKKTAKKVAKKRVVRRKKVTA